jgi:hypothetical protein
MDDAICDTRFLSSTSFSLFLGVLFKPEEGALGVVSGCGYLITFLGVPLPHFLMTDLCFKSLTLGIRE